MSHTRQKAKNATTPQQTEIYTSKVVRRKAKKSATLPKVDSEKESKLHATSDENYDEAKLPKYECHLVLKHRSPDLFTQLARNKNLNIPILTEIKSKRHYLTCRSCFESKLQRDGHRRKATTMKGVRHSAVTYLVR